MNNKIGKSVTGVLFAKNIGKVAFIFLLLVLATTFVATAAAPPSICISGYKLNESKVGLAGWMINVYIPSTGELVGSDVTDATGYWEVCGLVPGLYNICEVPQTGWTPIEPRSGCYNSTLVEDVNGDVTYINFTNTPEYMPCVGLTPGYWKNWDNHYNNSEFAQLLNGTIAENIAAADEIFSHWSSKPGKELTILKAHLLATQLTLSLTLLPDLPNPDDAYLTPDCTIEFGDGTINVSQVVNDALNILANPGNYTRHQILLVKDQLDAINNLAP